MALILWAKDVPHIPVLCSDPAQPREQLSNYGEALKVLILNYGWKTISGWVNCSGKVTSKNIIESVMGNRVTKSDWSSVKVQRVDGSYTKNLVLRCTLTGFERNHQAWYCSNLINHKSVIIRSCHTSVLLYNTFGRSVLGLAALHTKVYLNPWFITGFVDAEGCFALAIRNKKGRYYCEPRFAISLHNCDLALLKEIQIYFGGAGSIVKHGKDSSQYVITSVKQLSTPSGSSRTLKGPGGTVILTHFDSYPLITQKYADFCLFKMAVQLIQNKAHLVCAHLEVSFQVHTNNNRRVRKSCSYQKVFEFRLISWIRKCFPQIDCSNTKGTGNSSRNSGS